VRAIVTSLRKKGFVAQPHEHLSHAAQLVKPSNATRIACAIRRSATHSILPSRHDAPARSSNFSSPRNDAWYRA
jgi:hypothetical protein